LIENCFCPTLEFLYLASVFLFKATIDIFVFIYKYKKKRDRKGVIKPPKKEEGYKRKRGRCHKLPKRKRGRIKRKP